MIPIRNDIQSELESLRREKTAFSERQRISSEAISVLMAALERLSFAAECRDNTMGDQCRLIEVKAELAAANKQAVVVISNMKGGAA